MGQDLDAAQEPGVEGLVHVTELSWTKRITKPSEVLTAGEEVEFQLGDETRRLRVEAIAAYVAEQATA